MDAEFKDILRDHLSSASKKNPNYSLRSFAKTLGIPPSTLSTVMSGKMQPSTKFIAKVGPKLGLDETEVEEIQLATLSFKFENKFIDTSMQRIEEDKLAIVKDWYHYAILNLMRVKGFKSEAKWVADRLGLSIAEVQAALDRLERVGLLEIKNNQWTDLSNGKTTHINNKKTIEAAKQHQQQVFAMALGAIDRVDIKKRNHTGLSIAVKTSDMEAMKLDITKFRQHFLKKYDKSSSADEVFHLAIGLFPMHKDYLL